MESFDIEAEDGVEFGVARLVLAWEQLRRERSACDQRQQLGSGTADAVAALGERSKVILNAWLEQYVPMLVHRCGGVGASQISTNDLTDMGLSSICNGAEILAVLLEKHSSSLFIQPRSNNNENSSSMEDERGEEWIKGTLTMFTLAVAMYTSGFCDYENEHNVDEHFQSHQQRQHQRSTPWANAVLSELGSALSISALRLRYHPTPHAFGTPSPSPSCPPLIDMLTNAISVVKEAA